MQVRASLFRAILGITAAAFAGAALRVPDLRAQQPPPIADAGPDRTVAVGETVVLNGSGSLDPKEMTADFAWRFASRPPGSMATLFAPHAVPASVSVKPSFIADVEGDYVLELVLTEGSRTSVADWVVISTANSAPRADAGPDQAVGIGQSVILDGSGSTDSDGDPLTYSWTVTHPDGATTTLAGVTPSFTVPAPGTYVAELTVDDRIAGHVRTDHVTDTAVFSTANVAPVAVAGPDITASVGETVQFDGSLSHDRNGDELSYSWALISVPVLPVPSAEELASPQYVRSSLVVDKEGIFLVQLTVTDSSGAKSRDTLVVSTVNAAPLADAGSDRKVAVGAEVELDAGGTTDWNGDLLRFRWALLSQPEGGGATLDDPASLRPKFTANAAGTYVAQLIVDDGADPGTPYPSEPGAADTVVIIADDDGVLPATDNRNVLPVADAGLPQTVAMGQTVQLDAGGSTDADGDALTYRWAVLEQPNGNKAKIIQTDPTAPEKREFTFTKFGEHVLQLTVSDREREAVDTVLITTINTRPFAYAGPEQPAIPGDVVQLNGANEPGDPTKLRSRDVDGDPIAFDWALIARPEGSMAELRDPTSPTPTLATDEPGYYVVQLIVHEASVSNPLTTEKASIPATVVVAAPNTPPVANAGANRTVYVDSVRPVALDGSASDDADGDPLTYSWTITAPAGSMAELTGATTATPSLRPDGAGTYEVQLIVNDGKIDSAPDTVSVFVLNPPVANAGPDRIVKVGAPVALAGLASTSDTGTLTYAWRFTATPPGGPASLEGATTATPDFTANVRGLYVVELVVHDGTRASAPDTIGIRAGAAVLNTRPTLNDITTNTTVTVGSTLRLTLSATDPDNDPLSFFARPLPLPAGASLDAATGAFTFRPGADQVGSHGITFGVSDGLASDTRLVPITVLPPPPGTRTTVTGQLVDAEDPLRGVSGARVTLLDTGTAATTGPDGRFTLNNVLAGDRVLEIDAADATSAPDGSPYASRSERVTLIANAVNELDPFALGRVDRTSQAGYDPLRTTPTVVTNAALGVEVTVPAGSARNVDGSAFNGTFTISQIPTARLAAQLPPHFAPCQVITFQSEPASRVIISPVAGIRLGNPDNLPAGAEVEVWGLSRTSGRFVLAGIGTVSTDRQSIETSVVIGGSPAVFFAIPRAPQVAAAEEMNRDTLTRSLLGSGNVSQAITLPGYTSLDEKRSETLIYNSGAADPRPIIAAETRFTAGAPLPARITGTLSVAGITVAGPVFMDTAIATDPLAPGLSNGQAIRQAVQFDASEQATGAHPYRYVSTARYACSSVGAAVDGRIVTENQADSAFGAGWTLAGLEKLTPQADGSVLLSEGDGTARVFDADVTGRFFDPVGYPAAGPLAGVLDDLDGDGNLDMAIPSTGSGDVELLFGDGSGGFPVTRNFNAGEPFERFRFPDLHTIQTGDFDNNGIRDLVVNNQMSNKVRVYLGTGGGFYDTPVDLAVTRAQGVGVADFDLDGNDDIAVASGWRIAGSDNAIVFFGDGAGGFPRAKVYPFGHRNVGVELADFNNDGFPDVAVAGGGQNRIDVLLSDGAGEFRTTSQTNADPIEAAVGRYALAAADFNGDGNQDLVLTVNNQNYVTVYLGNGLGGFVVGRRPGIGFQANTVRVVDFDRDGDMDIVASGRFVGNVALLAGDGAGNFDLAATIPVATGGLVSAVLPGDFNHDGVPDLQVSSNGESKIFALIADAGFRSPGADFSQLTKNADGNYVRRMTDGTTIEYNAEGLMTARVDTNGNRTEYSYDANGLLSGISDPADPSRGTVFEYTDGTLSGITDVAGRSTFFQVVDGELVKMTDAEGNEWRYAYDANSKLSAFASARGFVTTVDYGFAGQYLGTNNPDGTSVSASIAGTLGLAQFDIGLGTEVNPQPSVAPEDRVSTLQDAKGNFYEMEVNEYGAVIRITDPIGRTTRLVRDADNLVRQSIRDNDSFLSDGTIPATVTTLLDYDERGNVTAQTEAAGTPLARTTRFFYEPVFNRVVKIVDPSNSLPDPACPTAGVPSPGVTCMEYDPTDGNLLKVTDAGGGEQTFSYDFRGLRETAVDANGNVTRFAYDFFGNVETTTNGAGDVTKLERDAAGDVTGVTEGFGTAEARTTSFVFDDLGRIVAETDPEGGISETVYDADGNTIAEIDETGIAATKTYDSMGRMDTESHPATGTVRRTYDDNGNLASLMDPTGNIAHFAYDAVNRAERTEDPKLGVRRFAYDLADNPKLVTDANGNATSFRYDLHGREIERANALGDTWTFKYDSRDNMVETVDAIGQTIRKTYDELNRLTGIELIEADGVTVEDTVTVTYDAHGLKRTAADGDSSLAWTYDGANRVKTAETIAAPGAVQPAVVLTHDYDSVGNRRGLTHGPDGVIVDGAWLFGHDGRADLTRVTTPAGGTIDLTYDPAGRLERIAYPTAAGMQVTYDALTGRPGSIAHNSGFAELARLDYGFDTDGKITSIADAGGTRSFTYDATLQLTGGGYPTETQPRSESYAYDAEGNRTSSHLSATYVHDMANRLGEDETTCYAYDKNGNLIERRERVGLDCVTDTSGATTTYEWDVLNRLTRIDKPDGDYAAYRYDAQGRRIEKDVNGALTRYVYDGIAVLLEYDGANSLEARYTHSEQVDQPLAMARGGQSFFYHTDHLGSVRLVTDGAGLVVSRYDYDSFGNIETASFVEGVANPYGFTAREYDAESGLMFYRARYYDPGLGRFISEDPFGFVAGDSNFYRYVSNNPTMLIDPSGFSERALDKVLAIQQTPVLNALGGALQTRYLWLASLLAVAAVAAQDDGDGSNIVPLFPSRPKIPPIERPAPKKGDPCRQSQLSLKASGETLRNIMRNTPVRDEAFWLRTRIEIDQFNQRVDRHNNIYCKDRTYFVPRLIVPSAGFF